MQRNPVNPRPWRLYICRGLITGFAAMFAFGIIGIPIISFVLFVNGRLDNFWSWLICGLNLAVSLGIAAVSWQMQRGQKAGRQPDEVIPAVLALQSYLLFCWLGTIIGKLAGWHGDENRWPPAKVWPLLTAGSGFGYTLAAVGSLLIWLQLRRYLRPLALQWHPLTLTFFGVLIVAGAVNLGALL